MNPTTAPYGTTHLTLVLTPAERVIADRIEALRVEVGALADALCAANAAGASAEVTAEAAARYVAATKRLDALHRKARRAARNA